MSAALVALKERLRALLDETHDPHVSAQAIAGTLSPAEREALIEYALPILAREEIRSIRGRSKTGGTKSSRWGRAREWAEQFYCVDGTWKRLGDCSVDDVDRIAEDYERRAAENAAYAAEFRSLADKMRAAGAGRVDDLLADEGMAA